MKMQLYERINKTINENNMFTNCTGVVLAVSGGSDSMTLLDFFIKNIFDFPFVVGHINHLLRKESNEEEDNLCKYCKTNNVEFHSIKIDIKKDCPQGVSTETYAREKRYEYLKKLRNKKNFSHIATAHNLNDNIETLLMNIIRGTGLNGLTSIPYVRDDLVVRPLIEIEKKDILAHCHAFDIPYATDKTNFENIYTRNFIRNDLMPLIKKINPNFNKTPLIALAKMDLSYIKEQGEKFKKHVFIPPNMVRLEKAHPALISYVLREVFFSLSGENLDNDHTKLILDLYKNPKTAAECQLPFGYYARVGYEEISFLSQNEEFFTIEKQLLVLGKNVIIGLGTINLKSTSVQPLYIRSKKSGDKVKVRGGTKSLKKLFSDSKIPITERGKYFVITDENDTPIYVHGFKIISENKIKIEFSNI